MTGFINIVSVLLLVLIPVKSFSFSDIHEAGTEGFESDGDSLIAEIAGPSGWTKVWGTAYHDDHNMLYVSGCPTNEVAYGVYSGGETVTWTVFDSVDYICGLGCYQDDQLFALTQSDPLNPMPFYLYTWNLDTSGIPMLPPDVYQLGTPFTGAMGGCEWDGEYLWIVDQNFEVDDNSIIYKYDLSTHSVVTSWNYGENGGVGVACVWDAANLRIWISDWFGGSKLMEHNESGVPTGVSYSILTTPTDIAYKYDVDFDGPGFFVGNMNANKVDFYDHTLTSLSRNTWGRIKSTFSE